MAAGHESPRIERLRAALVRGEREAASRFWRELSHSGAPIVEPIPGDDGHVLVSFVWRAEPATRRVLVLGGWHGYHASDNELLHLPGSDVWYRTYRMRCDTRATYHFLPDDPFTDASWWLRMRDARPDPWNPRQLLVPRDEAEPDDRESLLSIFALPESPDVTWTSEVDACPGSGMTRVLSVTSRALACERQVEVFLWSGCVRIGGPARLLLLFDGPFFRRALRVERLLAGLMERGLTPPLVAVFIGHAPGQRHDELHGSERFGAFVARELVPRLRADYHVSARREDTIIAGSSHGGLAAGLLALTYADVFGKVIALSGQFEWGREKDGEHEWMARRLAEEERQPLRWFLSVGERETWLGPQGGPDRVLANRRLRAVLEARGHDVAYRELHTGHDYLCWREALAEGLQVLARDAGASGASRAPRELV